MQSDTTTRLVKPLFIELNVLPPSTLLKDSTVQTASVDR